MNCRQVEGSVFPAPAVAAILEPNYIEARLHCDGGPRMEENNELQKKMTDVAGQPVYVIYDPVTETKLGEANGRVFEKPFIEFLKKALKK